MHDIHQIDAAEPVRQARQHDDAGFGPERLGAGRQCEARKVRGFGEALQPLPELPLRHQ
mgnify:CR=1 FL=1